MVYSSQSAAFRKDKHQFFSQISHKGTSASKFQEIDYRAETIGYTFLLENQKTLETEFTEMFATLQKQKNENN